MHVYLMITMHDCALFNRHHEYHTDPQPHELQRYSRVQPRLQQRAENVTIQNDDAELEAAAKEKAEIDAAAHSFPARETEFSGDCTYEDIDVFQNRSARPRVSNIDDTMSSDGENEYM